MNHQKNVIMFCRPALLAGLLGLSACTPVAETVAKDPATKTVSESDVPNAALDAVASRLPRHDGEIRAMDLGQPSAIPGFYDIVVDGEFFMVSADGRYVIQGTAYDRVADIDITEQALSQVRKQVLDEQAPPNERIVFAPKNPKYTVSIFTDISCGFCRRLHAQIDEYNQRGIAVEYLAFPRGGIGSENDLDMQSIWCAKDRKKALNNAMNGQSISSNMCENPVEKHHLLGRRLGLQGTPMMITASGAAIHGYLPPDMLEQRLIALDVQNGG